MKALFKNTYHTADITESSIVQAVFSRCVWLLRIVCVLLLLLAAGVFIVSRENALFLLLFAVACIWLLPIRATREVKRFRSQESNTVVFYEDHFTVGIGGRRYGYCEIRRASLIENALLLRGKRWSVLLAKDGFSETTCEGFCSFLQEKNIEIVQEKPRRSGRTLCSVAATVLCVLLALLNALTLNLYVGDPEYLYIGSTDTASVFAMYQYNHPAIAKESALCFDLLCKSETVTVGSVSRVGDAAAGELYGTFYSGEQWHAMPLSQCVLKTLPVDTEKNVVSYRLGNHILLLLSGFSEGDVHDSCGNRGDYAERFLLATGSEGCALLLTDVPADYVLYAEGQPLDADMLGIYEAAEGQS
ncbi:MAG: hypothetical protein ACI4V3_00865 [Faecousia sp.]